MTPEEALVIYNSGPQVVVSTLCNLSDSIASLQEQHKALEIKIAKLSKNPSNSSKRPSSDDITKPKRKKKDGKRTIGGQPKHPKHERPLFPKEEIHDFHSYILTTCPDCNEDVNIIDGKPKIIQQMELIEAPLIKLENLPLEAKVNVDETGHKENKKKFWTWVFKAELYVLFKIDKSRGSNVLIDVLGKEFNGARGCDYFSAYQQIHERF